jgi:uncharacterized protein
MMDLQLAEGSQPWLKERTILLGLSGSYASGTNTENSDKDYRGVCIPPVEYFLGLESFNEYNTSGGKNFKNTKDDIDVAISHITKFVRDAMAGAPQAIDLLFLRPQDYLVVTKAGQMLLNNRQLFLTKAVKGKFAGFANGQLQLMKRKGYDHKIFMQAVKMMTGVIEILGTGTYHTYRDEETRALLHSCRKGDYTFEGAIQLLDVLDGELKRVYESSTLPDKPDHKAINNLLIEINRTALNL